VKANKRIHRGVVQVRRTAEIFVYVFFPPGLLLIMCQYPLCEIEVGCRRCQTCVGLPQAVAAPESIKSTKSAKTIKASTIEDDNKYLLQNYGPRIPIVFTHGEGCHLYDTEGKLSIPFTALGALDTVANKDMIR
jgi:hypothetical protein